MRRQLDEKDRQIEKLTQLLDQQQQLNLSTNRQNEKLLDTTTNNTPSQEDSPPAKRPYRRFRAYRG
ncbi:DUF536 domain-containing protein [Lactiplantibacillus plantarum]|nr:DUF536 domain-containing protein [Lactiplantibacillus plantarum]